MNSPRTLVEFPKTSLSPIPGHLTTRCAGLAQWLRPAVSATSLLAVCTVLPAQLQFQQLAGDALLAGSDYTKAIALADLDADGFLDLVVGNGEPNGFMPGSQDRIWRNDGHGRFIEVTGTALPAMTTNTQAVAVGDIDGDGDIDMVTGGFHDHHLYLNGGGGGFTEATAGRVPISQWSSCAVLLVDVDGDGDQDLIEGNQPSGGGLGSSSGQDRLFLNDGSGFFTEATQTKMPPANDWTYTLQVGDVDSDGDIDIIKLRDPVTPGGECQQLYLNDGSGAFVEAPAGQLPGLFGSWRELALGDVDNDGDLDVLAGGIGAALLINDGTGTFSDQSGSRLPQTIAFGAWMFADIDLDGDLDLVSSSSSILINDGNGVYTDSLVQRMQSFSAAYTSIAVGDLDHDGDLDVVLGGEDLGIPMQGQRNVVLANLRTQLHAPAAPQVGQLFTLDVYARYGAAGLVDIALPFLGTQPAAIVIPSLGILGIDPTQLVPLAPILVPQPAGIGSLGFSVPNVPALANSAVYCQALMLPWPLAPQLSNTVAETIDP